MDIRIEYVEQEARIYLSSEHPAEFVAAVLGEAGGEIYSTPAILSPGSLFWIQTEPSLDKIGTFAVEVRKEGKAISRKEFWQDPPTLLCDIMKKHGSDKSTWHNYARTYHTLFSEMRSRKIDIFEMGLGTNNTSLASNMGADGVPGASLRAWKEYFTLADIFGADIDRSILFQEERIATLWCDQTDPAAIEAMWESDALRGKKMDIIIDDGLHEYHANLAFFEASISRLKPDGIFVIEDLTEETAANFAQSIGWLQEKHCCSMDVLELPYAGNHGGDNRLLIATPRHPLRSKLISIFGE